MKKKKLRIYSNIPFVLEGIADGYNDGAIGARKNAKVLYEVLCRSVSAETFLEFMNLLEEKSDIYFNPSKRKDR